MILSSEKCQLDIRTINLFPNCKDNIQESKYTIVICEKPSAARRIAQALNSTSSGEIRAYSFRNEYQNVLKPGSSFFSALDKKGNYYIICHALGHLYGLSDSKDRRNKSLPIFDPIWLPLSSNQSNKSSQSRFLKYKIEKILKEISEISKNATSFIHACDYDQEGEVIGYNILQFACNKKYDVSKRAKFSTMTDEEITQSFDNLLPPNQSLKDAGITRHTIDFIYGINFSRVLTTSIKKNQADQKKGKKFVPLSIGRVQGPTLAFVVDRENEILRHIPMPYWNVVADFISGGEKSTNFDNDVEKDGQKNNLIQTIYFPQKIDSKNIAIKIRDECKDQEGIVTFAKTSKSALKPQHPFNLGDLQREAFRVFKFTPSYTLSLAESLYLAALISYPRTSSQKLPTNINYKSIINNLSKIENRSFPSSNVEEDNARNSHIKKLPLQEICQKLLSKTASLNPHEGKEDDPAHPAIYPTGEIPKKTLEQSESKLFDLIIRRFLSTFGTDANVTQTSVNITVKEKHIFKSDEKKMLSKGWIEFYDPYFDYSGFVTNSSPSFLSILKINDKLTNIHIEILEKTTQPPSRYNQSTLLQKMEKEKIGTKATRSEIINTLYKRNYICNFSSFDRDDVNGDSKRVGPSNVSIKKSVKSETASSSNSHSDIVNVRRTGICPTRLGVSLIASMQKHVPIIVSTSLTRTMEERLSNIESGTSSSDSVIRQAQITVRRGLESFLKNQVEIGKEISLSLNTDSQTISLESKRPRVIILGRCPVCKKGNLIIKSSAKTKKRFAGCSNYSIDRCSATAPIPLKGLIRGTDKNCDRCKWPIVMATGNSGGKKYQWSLCLNKECPLKK